MLPVFTLCTSIMLSFPFICICIGVSCGEPYPLSNGCVETSFGNSFKDIAIIYTCDDECTLNGGDIRICTCQSDGQ